MDKIYKAFTIFLFIFLTISINNVTALDTLGTSKINEDYKFCQVCADASYITLSSIKTPNSNDQLDTNMTLISPGQFCYDYTPTEIGRYDFKGISDGCDKTFAVYLDVTPSGFANTLGFYFIILIILGALIVLGFAVKDGWFVIFGGMGFIALGLYSINNGIAGFRDMFLTWGTSLFLIGVGAYLAINAALEIINETD